MTENKPAAKKVAAAKVAHKKAAPKTPAATAVDAPVDNTVPPLPVTAVADPSGLQPDESKSSTSIAQEILDGSRRWGTGRDRVAMIKAAGHDSDEVLKELSRLRAAKRRADQRA